MRGDIVVEGDDLRWIGLAVDVEGCEHEVGEADAGFLDEGEEGDGAAIGVVVRLEVDNYPGESGWWDGGHLF